MLLLQVTRWGFKYNYRLNLNGKFYTQDFRSYLQIIKITKKKKWTVLYFISYNAHFSKVSYCSMTPDLASKTPLHHSGLPTSIYI